MLPALQTTTANRMTNTHTARAKKKKHSDVSSFLPISLSFLISYFQIHPKESNRQLDSMSESFIEILHYKVFLPRERNY